MSYFFFPILIAFFFYVDTHVYVRVLSVVGVALTLLRYFYISYATHLKLSVVITALIVLIMLVIGAVIVYKVVYPPTPLNCDDIRGREQSSIETIKTLYCKPLTPLPPKIVGPLPSWEQQLPYVNNRKYLEALSRYTCAYP